MKSKELSFLVVGAGAIGGITAALLKKNGYDVEVLCNNDDYAAFITGHGIEISGICGNHTVRIPAYSSASGIRPGKDIILHATKAVDMVQAAKSAEPLLKEDGFFVSMQNGFCEDELASVAGSGRVIGCVTGWGATMESRGKFSMTSSGDFILGYPGKAPDELLGTVAEALSSVAPARTTGNIEGHLYSKLIINSCITSLGAICGLYLGNMLAERKIRNIFIQIIREAVAVAEKAGIRMEVFGGSLDFSRFIAGKNLISGLKRHLIIRVIGFRYRRLKSSSLQSLERQKPTEIDYLNGYIVKIGEKHGVEVPVNKRIVEMIHEIEAGKRSITPANFEDPVFNRLINY